MESAVHTTAESVGEVFTHAPLRVKNLIDGLKSALGDSTRAMSPTPPWALQRSHEGAIPLRFYAPIHGVSRFTLAARASFDPRKNLCLAT